MRLFTPILAVAIWVFTATTGEASTSVSDDDVRGRAITLLAQMTPQEKVGQMSQFFYLPVGAWGPCCLSRTLRRPTGCKK
jgi:hypothetical protein